MAILKTVLAISVDGVIDRFTAITSGDVVDRLRDHAGAAVEAIVSIAIVVIVAMLILRVLRSFVQNIVERVLSGNDQTQRDLQQKAQTLANVIESTGRFIVFVIAGMMILSNLGFQIAPLLASAGIAGLAIGLGAQSLIKDTINGFFILMENQFGVGDVIAVGASSGTVEEISLRRTVLRAVNGAQVIIPNGEIRTVENLSKGWSRAVLDIETAANVDDAKVLDLLHEMLDHAQEDPLIGSKILEPPQILGISSISVTGVTFRVLVKTEPLQQWMVERELRLRIRQTFIENGIAMPVLTSATIAPS
ncbi:MAG TPA: mechanosensitive ion channel family protein [Thermomicrobiales bacterium]|nr:mechanosensitive ion channel family protein [Thermomicrobiales bacterium]